MTPVLHHTGHQLHGGTRGPAPLPDLLTVGTLRISRAAWSAGVGTRRLPLTSAQFLLLVRLAETPGVAVSRDALSRAAFSKVWRRPEDRSVDAIVHCVRQALRAVAGAPEIRSVRTVGYALAVRG